MPDVEEITVIDEAAFNPEDATFLLERLAKTCRSTANAIAQKDTPQSVGRHSCSSSRQTVGHQRLSKASSLPVCAPIRSKRADRLSLSPKHSPITPSIFSQGKSSSVDEWLSRLMRPNCVPLSETELDTLVGLARPLLAREPNLVQVTSPVNVCGDIHGQFHDLLKLLKTGGGLDGGINFLFMGDYVDRGRNSLETIQLLLCLKVKHPRRVTLLRGNHESRSVSSVFGFYDECVQKYGNAAVWRKLTDLFDYLPVSGLVDGRILCMHGGLSPLIRRLDQLGCVDRVQEVGQVEAISDLLWSDPSELHEGWEASTRGTGHTFGHDVTTAFSYLNRLDLVARAHQVVMQGFHLTHHQGLVTVFSAPNYMYRVGNLAAIMQVRGTQSDVLQFTEEEVGEARSSDRAAKTDSLMEYFE